MNSKVILLSFAVVAVGLFALPSTMSLFSGQHTWYNGSSVDCKKCHQDIYEEISTSEYHESWGVDCVRCHATVEAWNKSGVNITYGQWKRYSGSTLKGAVNVTAHAAVTVECLACHGYSNTSYANKIQGASEAHRDYYYESVSDKDVGDINQTSIYAAYGYLYGMPTWYTTSNQTVVKLKGTNTACIGCHTHSRVNITWRRSVGYGLSVNYNTVTGAPDIPSDSWNVNATKNTTYTSSE
jgi:hypothetical protein